VATEQQVIEDGDLQEAPLPLGFRTNTERRLLMYFETCLVDQSGRVEGCRMNDTDMALAREFEEAGLIKFGRLLYSEMIRLKKMNLPQKFTHWVQFSGEAWARSHKLRFLRAVDNPCDESRHGNKQGMPEETSPIPGEETSPIPGEEVHNEIADAQQEAVEGAHGIDRTGHSGPASANFGESDDEPTTCVEGGVVTDSYEDGQQ